MSAINIVDVVWGLAQGLQERDRRPGNRYRMENPASHDDPYKRRAAGRGKGPIWLTEDVVTSSSPRGGSNGAAINGDGRGR